MDMLSLLLIVKQIVAAIGVFVILWGALQAIYRFATRWKKRNHIDIIRLDFARAIILGLEFIVAADVIATTTSPDYYSLGILASLVAIRTLLTYFMNKEVNKLSTSRKKQI
jgi:uncharacterized membrane protein